MARGDGSGFCGFAKGFLVSGGSGSLSDRAPLARIPGGGRTGPPREVVEISSDEEEDDGSTPVARKLRFDAAADEGASATGGYDLGVGKKSGSCGVGKEDDDCVVLDRDPDGAVAVAEEKGSARFDGGLDELQIVAEKGQVSRHQSPGLRSGSMARGDGSGFCGFAKGFLVSGGSGSLSDRAPLARIPGGGRTGPPREIVEISSDEEEDDGSTPVARKLRFDAAADEGASATGGYDLGVGKKSGSCGVGKEDDDCVVLDRDPDGAVAVAEEKGSAGFDGGLDELQIVAEKGQVACRDFPHSRHLCSKLRFSATSHVKHCSMCYCFVCDAPAPCTYWGKGLSTDDHCHATDKEIRWTTLRQTFKRKHLPASHSEKHQNVMYPAMVPLRQQDIQRQVSALQSDPFFLSGQTVGAPRVTHLTREGRGRDNTQTAQATRPHTPCGQEPYQQEDREGYTSEEEDEEYTSEEEDEEYTSQEDDEYASEKAKVYVGNLHYDIVREDLDELFGQAGFVEFSEVVYSPQTWQSCGFGFVTMSTVKEAELAVEIFNGFKMHGRRLTVQHKAARRVARVEAPLCQSESPFRLYVGNLPSQASDSWLKALFSEHGKVVEARVVDKEHDGRAWRSRGFGFVKMATEEESYVAIEALDKQIMEGRPLRVEVAKERPR